MDTHDRARTRARSRRKTAGYSLIEMLAYVGVLAVIINLGAGALVSVVRVNHVGMLALERIEGLEEIRREFRQSVRASTGVAADAGPFRSGVDQLVLEMPADEREPATRRFTVFLFSPDKPNGEEGVFLRKLVVVQDPSGDHAEALVCYPLRLDSVRFTYDADSPDRARLVTLTVTAGAHNPPRPIAAAVRGEEGRNAP